MPDNVLLVTGGNGLLGTKLIELCLRHGAHRPVSVSRQPCSNGSLGAFEFHQLDLTNGDSVGELFERLRPRWVVHTAAMTNVDGCERQPEAAWRANADAAEAVAQACRTVDAHLVHLSTEYVFDGRSGPYGEEDPANPISVYGRTKLASEQAILRLRPSAAIARTTVLYGYALNARPNFVTWLIGKLNAGEAVKVVNDQIGSPTLADNLAEMCFALALGGASGVYNTVGADCLDRYAFALTAAEIFGLDHGLIRPVSTAGLAQPARRPLRAGLRMDKFRQTFPDVPVLGVLDGLEVVRRQLDVPGR
jgi:dTDP-4-dehydrorhamnose reductase